MLRFSPHGLAQRLSSSLVDVLPEVQNALKEKRPVVALESTIMTHGMPWPTNYETAVAVENIVRQQGAVPATIAIYNGRIKVGLEDSIMKELAQPSAKVVKTSRRDFSYVTSQGLCGGTTVSGTIYVANMLGIKIIVTGGIGGVHRLGESTMDVSADLTELGRTNIMVVSSGIKSILDIGRTLEYLETQGVSVVSYGKSKEFPAFYSRESGFKAPYNIDCPKEAAKMMFSSEDLQLDSGILMAVPVPQEYSLDNKMMEETIEAALNEAQANNVIGRDVTPFILDKVANLTKGTSLKTNVALIQHNARIGSQIACELEKLHEESGYTLKTSNGIAADGKPEALSLGQ